MVRFVIMMYHIYYIIIIAKQLRTIFMWEKVQQIGFSTEASRVNLQKMSEIYIKNLVLCSCFCNCCSTLQG